MELQSLNNRTRWYIAIDSWVLQYKTTLEHLRDYKACNDSREKNMINLGKAVLALLLASQRCRRYSHMLANLLLMLDNKTNIPA